MGAEMARGKPGNGNNGNNPYARKSATPEELAQRRIEAMQLRLQGLTISEIARQQGLGNQTVHGDLKLVLAEYMKEHEATTIPQYREMELRRLDRALVEANKIIDARSGTELALKAIDRILRAVNLRSELLGLKVPIEVNLKKVEVTQADLELAEIIREAEVANQLVRDQILAEANSDDTADPRD